MSTQHANTSMSQQSLGAPSLAKMQTKHYIGGFVVFFLLALISYQTAGWQMAILSGVGLLLGYTLFHARFGFTSAFRRLVAVGNGEALRAHMLMLAVATTLFAPILYFGAGLFGTDPTGYVSPVGISVIIGSLIFGIGMQLGNGCASGTLYAVGGGRSSMIITLIGFIIGSVVGAYHFEFWMEDMPAGPAISLATDTGLGYFGAWILQMVIFAAVVVATIVIAKKRKPPKMAILPTTTGIKRMIRGSWPLWVAALLLAGLNALTLVLRGQPWGITSAFALWGSQIVEAFGFDVSQWYYWSEAQGTEALNQSVFNDTTSVMNFGIMIGAFLASAAGGVFALKKIPFKIGLAALIGGLMMGYGARLAFGCNIGAYFGGIASFSVHGWVWMIFAMLGTYIALFIRPLFGISNPKPNDSVC